jgi:endonuclease-3 related protein
MNVFEKLYKELKKKYGTPKGQWQLWCKRTKSEGEREEVVMGAILTQRTNWKNVELAIENLKKAKINSLRDIYQLGERGLASLIKPSRFYQTKVKSCSLILSDGKNKIYDFSLYYPSDKKNG